MSVSDTRHHHRTTAGTVLVLVELLCVALSPPFLHRAVMIWDNVFGENDSGVLLYTVFAIIAAAPGVMLLAIAMGLHTRARPHARRRQHTGTLPSRLGTVTTTEWTIGAMWWVLATLLWLPLEPHLPI